MASTKPDRKQMLGSWKIRDQYFSDVHMFTRVKTVAELRNLKQTYRALYYMKEKHSGQTRKAMKYSDAMLPYIIHPLMMACHALSMNLLDDELLAAILLHDVCEDCSVAAEDLPFSPEVRRIVDLVTKKDHPGLTKEEYTREYYQGISGDPKAMVVKILDRCNNVSTMALSFSDQKLNEYIQETEDHVMPLLKKLKQEEPEYHNAVFLIKYQLLSLLESLKVMLLEKYPEEEPLL